MHPRVSSIRSLSSLAILGLSFIVGVRGQQDDIEPVTISYQTELSAVAHYIAKERGYYTELGLDIKMERYPSGNPQIGDVANWDMGGAGVVPSIIGGSQDILNVGISMDQSSTNQLVGNANGAANWPPTLSEGNPVPICVAPNSTGDYVVQACLRSQGIELNQVQFIYEPQQVKCIEAMTPVNGSEPIANFGGLWAPNTYIFLNDVEGAATICSGSAVYATVTGAHMARKKFAEQKPHVVARVLAGWLRAVEFINKESNLETVLDYMATFYTEHGVDIPRSSLELDLRLVGLFPLDQQLDLMVRRSDPPLSNYDIWTNQIGEFMLENGVVSSVAPPSTYITDRYLNIINQDEMLRAFALNREEAENSAATSARIFLTVFPTVVTILMFLQFSLF